MKNVRYISAPPVRANPFRKGTKHWLPEDVGAFEFMPTDKKNVSIRKPRGATGWIITLPDGNTVAVEKLGKGHSTQAYRGVDGWAYLFVKPDARDPAKDVLVDLTARLGEDAVLHHPFAVHIPWIEHVGWAGKTLVFREPLYLKLAKGSSAAKQARALAKLDVNVGAHKFTVDYKRAQVDAVAALATAGKIPQSVADAVAHMSEFLEDYGDGWVFEFPPRNLAQDADGNLILLDVIFDLDALQKLRREKASAPSYRGAP